jgi:protein-S-isoprenylcysteine O-methyltransferase Ste14
MVMMLIRAIVAGVTSAAVIAAILFVSAGRWDLPFFWAYIGIWISAAMARSFLADPTLLKERLQPGPGGKDKLRTIAYLPLGMCEWIIAGLDVGRYHWSDTVPLAVQVGGLVAFAGGAAVVIWATAANRFFSTVIRIQTERGHHVIDRGPYRFVRHPAYAAFPFLIIGGGLLLGSWLAAVFGLVLVFPVLRRTALEDRTLRQELEGYADYAKKVRYRVMPGIW